MDHKIKAMVEEIENSLEQYTPLYKIGIAENIYLFALSEVIQKQRLDAYRDGYVDGYLDGRQ